MSNDDRIDDIIAMLDQGVQNGVGHININTDETLTTPKTVQTMGCTDCSRTPLACSVPTLEQGLDHDK